MYRIYGTKGDQRVTLERDDAVDAFRAVARLRELGWEVRVSR